MHFVVKYMARGLHSNKMQKKQKKCIYPIDIFSKVWYCSGELTASELKTANEQHQVVW